MSLRDEMADDIEQIIDDYPVEFWYQGISHRGRKSYSVPTNDSLLDAGYKANVDMQLLVTLAEMPQIQEREQITIGDGTGGTQILTVMAVKVTDLWNIYDLKNID